MASFREGVETLEDLKSDMVLEGVVTNVTNFGAFVDIGVHQDGLVHVSELARKFVRDPREVVRAGDLVNVSVLEVDLKRRRISLSIKAAAPAEPGKGPGAAPLKSKPSQPPTPGPRGEKESGGFNQPFSVLKNLKKRDS
jgi:uncharacterized protein